MSCSKPDGGEAGNCNGAQLCHIEMVCVAWNSNSYQKEKGMLSKKFLNICQPKSLHHDNLDTDRDSPGKYQTCQLWLDNAEYKGFVSRMEF